MTVWKVVLEWVLEYFISIWGLVKNMHQKIRENTLEVLGDTASLEKCAELYVIPQVCYLGGKCASDIFRLIEGQFC